MTYDDQDEQLSAAFRTALRDEPPMTSLAHDDLLRGRRRLRHRRIATATAAAAVVPAAALVASAVPGGLSAGPASPSFAGSPSASSGNDNGTLTSDCGSASVATLRGQAPRPTKAAPETFRAGKGHTSAMAPKAAVRSSERPIMRRGNGHLSVSDGGGGLVAAGDSSDCEAVPGEPMDTSSTDRLEAAMSDVLDPTGQHASMLVAGVVARDATETVSEATVTGTWTEGEAQGQVSLTIVDPAADSTTWDSQQPCEDPGVVGGPQLTCERRQLDDGSSVLVGTGDIDGLARITVRFDRGNGEVVWATADQADWTQNFDGQPNATPLDAPPATVDQLIALAQDDRAHL